MKTSTQSITGGAFVIHNQDPSSVFTPEDFNEEERMMKEAVQEFVDREIWPNKARFEQKDYELTKSLMQKAGELGFLSISVPEAYGGMGMDFIATMLVCDYISGATGSFSTAYGAHTGIGTMPITLYGTEVQKHTCVPKLASGEWFGAYCLTEPGAGSDANSGKTKAVLSEDGTHYKITGQKMWISNAGFANLFIVFARIEDDKNISSFIVPVDLENGISLGEEEHKLGIHSSSTRQVFFNETKVPVANMLGQRGGGFKIAMNALNVGRIKLAAACLDAQRRVIGAAVGYATERIQFNTPIAQFGAIKEKIARMTTNCYVGEAATYRAGALVRDKIATLQKEGIEHQEAELKGVEEFAIECSILKVAVSEDIQNCADDGIQIYGGMGFSADTPMESAWRDARIGRIYEGTNEINSMLAVGMLLKKALKGQLDLMSPVMQLMGQLGSEMKDEHHYEGPLAQEMKRIKALKDAFLLCLGAAVQKYGPEVEKNQQVLLAAAAILIKIYMAESAVLRTEKNIQRSGEKEQLIPLAMTQVYVYNAVDLVLKKGKEIIHHIATKDQKTHMLKALHECCSYENAPDVFSLNTSIADKIIEEKNYCF